MLNIIKYSIIINIWGCNGFDIIPEKWIASSGFSLATLKNGKININAENNNEYALAAA